MNVKAAITLILALALVFQLSQVLSAAAVTSPCASHEVSCACCERADSCPCAKTSEEEQKPAPLVPNSGIVLKLPAARACDTRVSIESAAGNSPSSSTVAASPAAVTPGAYAGVRLSVALCSFVI